MMPGSGSTADARDFGAPQLGDVAQLAEHLLCKQGVVGSIPIVSTDTVARAAGPRKGAGGGYEAALYPGRLGREVEHEHRATLSEVGVDATVTFILGAVPLSFQSRFQAVGRKGRAVSCGDRS